MISRQIRRCMATDFDFQLRHRPNFVAEADALLTRAHEACRDLEQELTEFLPGSPVRALNEAPVMEWVSLPQSASELLDLSLKLCAWTRGAFDPTVKSRGEALRVGAFERFEFDFERRRVRKRVEGAHLGFGAIGKGYALDRVRSEIERAGYRDFLLSAGGSSLVISGYATSDRKPWRWGWSWEKAADGSLKGVEFDHCQEGVLSIGVSGTMEQGAHLLGVRRSLPDQPLSLLFAHPSATLSDALSTAAFVGGWQALANVPGIAVQEPAIAEIDSQKVPRWNEGFRKRWSVPAQWLASLCFGFFFSVNVLAQEIDLSSLGGESFNPYVFERDDAWIALPALTLFLVLLHLRRSGQASKRVQAPSSWLNDDKGKEE